MSTFDLEERQLIRNLLDASRELSDFQRRAPKREKEKRQNQAGLDQRELFALALAEAARNGTVRDLSLNTDSDVVERPTLSASMDPEPSIVVRRTFTLRLSLLLHNPEDATKLMEFLREVNLHG